MFGSFSFDTPRSPSVDSNNTTTTSSDSRSVSPCSATAPYPAPRYSVTDLSADFGRQRLRQNSQIYSQPCEAYANLEDDAGWAIDDPAIDIAPRVRASSPIYSSSTRRRADRQANARLLCSASHHRDIAALVSRMVSAQDQCLISPPSAITQSPVEDDEYDCSELAPLSRTSTGVSSVKSSSHRRTSDLRKTGTSINKDTRLKKDKPRRQRSSDKA